MTKTKTQHRQKFILCMVIAMLAVFAGRTKAGAGSSPYGRSRLLFAARAVDTAGAYSGPPAAATVNGKALHIIQFYGPIQDEWLAAVEETGAELVHYIADYGYLVWTAEASRSRLDRLAARSDFLRYSAPFTSDLKTDRLLRRLQTGAVEDETIVVTIQMLRHDGRVESERLLDSIIDEQLAPWDQVLNYQNMRAVISVSEIATITNLPDVVWVGAWQPPQLMDEKQAQILAGNLNVARTEPGGPGYLAWLKQRGFSEDPQKYPIIDITDDGIGNGVANTAAGDSTLRAAGNPDLPSRIAYLENCTQVFDAGGPDGHGHLNASIAVGFDKRSGEPYQDLDKYQLGMGLNPFGRIAGTRVFDGPFFDISRCDSSYLSMVRQSYRAGARIVSNSWGCTSPSCTGLYTTDSQAYDTAVRDADSSTPGNQEMLILFSAGNAGSPESVGTPANGKNVIAVGASENVRPSWTDACGFGGSDADNLQDIASYSSRGPAPGGRLKPDLVAPGTHITGTASTSPNYNGSAICDMFYPDNQRIFAASTGTSHSVPAIAGIASLTTYWLAEKYGIENPSPALLKAYLIANSSYLSGSGANDDLPSNNQGYGLPDMNKAFGKQSRVIIEQGRGPLFDRSGQFWKSLLRSVDPELPVRVVMAFTDYPGAVWVSDPQVNNLDLVVTVSGKRYLGNEMDGQWSRSGGTPDKVNTVEAVFLPAGAVTSFEVKIEAENIAGDGVPGEGDKTDQDFVLVCDNCLSDNMANYKYHVYYPIFYP